MLSKEKIAQLRKPGQNEFMSYQVYFPETDIKAQAVVMDLAVHFSRGIDSIRLRSTESTVNGIKRAFPSCEIFQGERRIA